MSGPDVRVALAADTAADVEAIQIRRWREMSLREKATLVTSLSQAADAMAMAGIRAAYPSASPRELFLRLAIRRLGFELAAHAYAEIADLPDSQ